MDAALIWRDMGADCAIEGLALVEDSTLKTAVILSLFLDRRAEVSDDIPDGTTNRRGWWGDAYADIEGDFSGSRLWLLSREKQLSAVPVRAVEYADEALAWLKEDGIVSKVETHAEWVRTGVLGLRVRLYKPDAPAVEYKFETLWEAL